MVAGTLRAPLPASAACPEPARLGSGSRFVRAQAIKAAAEQLGDHAPPEQPDRILVRFAGPSWAQVRRADICTLHHLLQQITARACALTVHHVQGKVLDADWLTSSDLWVFREAQEYVLVRCTVCSVSTSTSQLIVPSRLRASSCNG